MDVRSVTGSNMRNIMLLVDKMKVEDVILCDWKSIPYFKQRDEDVWKTSMIWEIVNSKTEIADVPGFDYGDLELILHHLCTE